ncbi:CPBP family intramembrane glutamic endopeptidase [Enterovibrio calviensis]|uniref:CPBP family intramembrane glutamic endopeptidase n=1 Tax=Enterovibrio calviensis TaxID=91359 RepID=UPI0037362F25
MMYHLTTNLIYRSFEMKPVKFLLAMYTFAALWAVCFGLIIDTFIVTDEFIIPNGGFMSLLLLILIIAPIIETVIFQFLMQGIFRRGTKNIITSVLLTAFLFSASHSLVGIDTVFIIAGLGIVLSLVYEYFRSRINDLVAIFSVIFFHLFWNGVIGFIIWLDYSHIV